MVKSKISTLYPGAIMASGLCFHFFGNELARAASVSLISAKEIGLGSSALTYTVLFGFPASALTLYLYTSSIKSRGAAWTFRMSCLICLSILVGMSYAASTDLLKQNGFVSQLIVVAFYAFREIYSTLLSTQQWAFIVSALDHSTASYIVTFSGAVSIISTLGGVCVEHVVAASGVRGLLVVATLSVLCTIASSELAYWTHTPKVTTNADRSKEKGREKERSSTMDASSSPRASTHNSKVSTTTPSSPFVESTVKSDNNSTHIDTRNNNSASNSLNNSSNNNNNNVIDTSTTRKDRSPSISKSSSDRKISAKSSSFSMWKDSMRLLGNSTLQLLVVEAVVHQSCSNMLNIMFYDGLRHVVTVDDTRAVLVGRFFATVNFSSCLLQFFVMPYILTQKTLPTVMMYIPILVCCVTALCSMGPSLISVMLSFGVLKVLEYAVLAGAMEMVYMPLDSETRYLGKEYVRFFGSKLGKTGASLALTTLTAQIRPSLTTQCLWSLSLAVAWSGVMTILSSHLSDKIKAAESAHAASVSSQQSKDVTALAPGRDEGRSDTERVVNDASGEAAAQATNVRSSPRSQKQVPAVPVTSAFGIAWDNMSSVSRKRSRTMSVCDADYSFMFSPADILGALSEEDADTSDESEPSDTPRIRNSSFRKRSTSSHSFPTDPNMPLSTSVAGGLGDLSISSSSNLLIPPIPSPRRALLKSLRRSRKKTILRVRSRSEPLGYTMSDSMSQKNLSGMSTGGGIPRSVSGLRLSSDNFNSRSHGAPASYEEYQALFGNMDSSSTVSYKAPISFSEFSNLVVAALDSESSTSDDRLKQASVESHQNEVSTIQEDPITLPASVHTTSGSSACVQGSENSACDKTDEEPCETPDSVAGFPATTSSSTGKPDLVTSSNGI